MTPNPKRIETELTFEEQTGSLGTMLGEMERWQPIRRENTAAGYSRPEETP